MNYPFNDLPFWSLLLGAVLVANIFTYLIRRPALIKTFMEDAGEIRKFIFNSDRFNMEHAEQAAGFLNSLEKRAFNKKMTEQHQDLRCLWKAKFQHLY